MAQTKSRGDLSNNDVVHIPFTKAALMDIKKLADDQGKSVSQVIQESVAVNRWITDTNAKGGKVIGERNGKRYDLLSK